MAPREGDCCAADAAGAVAGKRSCVAAARQERPPPARRTTCPAPRRRTLASLRRRDDGVSVRRCFRARVLPLLLLAWRCASGGALCPQPRCRREAGWTKAPSSGAATSFSGLWARRAATDPSLERDAVALGDELARREAPRAAPAAAAPYGQPSGTSGSSNPPLSWMLRLEETSRRLEEQVHQLTRAVQTLQRTVEEGAHSPSSRSASSSSFTTAPKRHQTARLLIDGTWLYYSLYERRGPECPIARRFGRDWPLRYSIDWARLPNVVQMHLRRQSGASQIDVESCTVFTSYKADTSPNSWRYRMFEGMKKAGYRVHMMETLGKLEKCVDIALAVELLHAECDVALLLTGDKDFLPAMVRARTPSKKLGLVSIRGSCNRALSEPPPGELLDFGVIWLEDYLEDLLVLREGHEIGGREPSSLSLFTVMKILNDYIEQSGVGRVSSRDAGRYLKFLRIGPTTVSDELKRSHGGLRQMLRLLPDVYKITVPDDEGNEEDKSFWIELTDNARDWLEQEARSTALTSADRAFLERYTLQPLQDKQVAYWYTLFGDNPAEPRVEVAQQDLAAPDYSSWTVVQLKELCRERNLPVSGTKAMLVERLQTDQVTRPQQGLAEIDDSPGRLEFRPTAPPKETSDYLVGLIAEYLQANGGTAGSRNVGRYLAANKPSKPDWWISALQELKSYCTLSEFVQSHGDKFGVEDEHDLLYGFSITLKKGAATASGTH